VTGMAPPVPVLLLLELTLTELLALHQLAN
jgi:hypothetical protein